MTKLSEKQIEWLQNMGPFTSINHIPSLPITEDEEEFKNIIVKNVIRCGGIPKKDLEIGATYEGHCRNASIATWDGNEFNYQRYKFGMTYPDSVKHFEDDMYYDVFIPINKI